MKANAKARGWRRHFDGWQAGAIVLLLVGSAVMLGLPKAVAPGLPPGPTLDNQALTATMVADNQHALSAQAEQLDADIRRVGSLVRQYNEATASGDEFAVQDARAPLLRASRQALAYSTEELLQLRAYQMLRFIEELRTWTQTGTQSDELRALGGDFVATLGRNRWCKPGSRALVLNDRELRVLFKKRWNDITGLHGPSFDLTVDEDRVRFGFLMRHPFGTDARPGTRAAVIQAHTARMALLQRLAEIDPSYPTDLARGMLLFQIGRYAQAGDQFRRHLAQHPDGPHTLRATNYLKAALDMAVNGVGG